MIAAGNLDTGNLDTGNLDTGNLDTGNLDTVLVSVTAAATQVGNQIAQHLDSKVTA